MLGPIIFAYQTINSFALYTPPPGANRALSCLSWSSKFVHSCLLACGQTPHQQANQSPFNSQIRRIDSQLDRLQLSTPRTGESFSTLTAEEAHDPAKSARIAHLQTLIKSLSTTTSSTSSLVPGYRILETLQRADLSSSCSTCAQWFAQATDGDRHEDETRDDASYEHELEWLLLSKATTQAYGQVLNTILEQTIPLEDDIWYWDDILSTYRFAGLYSVQTSPIRVWKWSQEIYHDVRSRGGQLADGWSQFYGLVKDSVRERSIANIQRRVVSPLAMVRNEGRRKRAALKKIRLINANALGVLLGEGLSNDRYVNHRGKWASIANYP